jgi:hypothetical protein
MLILSLFLMACLPSCVSMNREIPDIRVSATEHPRIFKLKRNPRRIYSYDAYLWIPEALIDVGTNRLMGRSQQHGPRA